MENGTRIMNSDLETISSIVLSSGWRCYGRPEETSVFWTACYLVKIQSKDQEVEVVCVGIYLLDFLKSEIDVTTTSITVTN
jgi:hypothetical protein